MYAEPPFGGPQQVLEHLGRYTHGIAISNERLLDVSDGEVTFQWKDYGDRDRHKPPWLSRAEASARKCTILTGQSRIGPDKRPSSQERITFEEHAQNGSHPCHPACERFLCSVVARDSALCKV